jgi:hypothetical protein
MGKLVSILLEKILPEIFEKSLAKLLILIEDILPIFLEKTEVFLLELPISDICDIVPALSYTHRISNFGSHP